MPGECPELLPQALSAKTVLLLLPCLAGLSALVLLAAAVRRQGHGGPCTRYVKRAFPAVSVPVEVYLLWQVLTVSTTASSMLGFTKDFLGCHNNSNLTDTSVWLVTWLLPGSTVLLLLFLALLRELGGSLAEPLLRQVTEDAGGRGNPSHHSWFSRAAFSLKAALTDAAVASMLLFLPAHALVVHVSFHALSCAGGSREPCKEGDPILLGFGLIFAALINVVTPTLLLVFLLKQARTHRLRSSPSRSSEYSACAQLTQELNKTRGQSRDNYQDARDLSLRNQTTAVLLALLPCEPWLAGQLALDILAVASVEVGLACGTEEGHQLGLAWAQIAILAEVVLMLWPRWLVDSKLLRFNAAARISLLIALQMEEVCHLQAAWPWLVLLVFLTLWALLLLFRWASSRSIRRATEATSLARGLHDEVKPMAFDPLVGLATDISKGSLSIILSDPMKLTAVYSGLSKDEVACLEVAAELISCRLEMAAELAGNRDTSSTSASQSFLDIMAATFARDLERMADESHSTTELSGSQEWVAPLPLLASEAEMRQSWEERLQANAESKMMMSKKWVLDHFVPASNGPEMTDTFPLGASAVTPQPGHERVANVSSTRSEVPFRDAKRSQLQPVPRVFVNSRSAEDLSEQTRSDSMKLDRRSLTGPLSCSQVSMSGLSQSSKSCSMARDASKKSTWEAAADLDWHNILAGLPADSRVDSERFWQSDPEDDLGDPGTHSVDLKVFGAGAVESALDAAKLWPQAREHSIETLASLASSYWLDSRSWSTQHLKKQSFIDLLERAPPGCLLRLLAERNTRKLSTPKEESDEAPDSPTGSPKTLRISKEVSVTSSQNTYELFQAAIYVTRESPNANDTTNEKAVRERLEKQLELLKLENAMLRAESDQMKIKRGENCWRPKRDDNLDDDPAATDGGNAAEDTATHVNEEPAITVSEPVTCAEQGAEFEEAVETGSKSDDKQAQWEKWKARKEAKKAQAGKMKYGEWLKNMADG